LTILSSDEYPAIRAAIDTELDTATLPDTIIALDIYAGAADQDVYARDPAADSRTGEDANRILRAAIYFCAARLCPVVVRVTSINVSARDLNYSRPAFDPEKRSAELRQMAEEELAEVLEPDEETPLRPTMFNTASGTRGR